MLKKPFQYLIPALFFLFYFSDAPAQLTVSGTLKDAHSDESIPFASVSFLHTTIGKLTDSSGYFSFVFHSIPSDTLEITCVGFQRLLIYIDRNKGAENMQLQMEAGAFNEGVIVKSKVNPGLYVWKRIVQNKPKNDRYRFDNFSYELYNKLELDIKNINFEKLGKIKPLKPITDIVNKNVDTSEGIKFLPAYFTESISDYYFQKKPLKRREVIRAVNMNGVENESVMKYLGGMDQVVNIYSNFITVFDKQFISPASDNGDLYYNYRVADTQQINNRRFFHLVFTPRRKGTNTFEGDCWVQAVSFAVQKMNLRLGKEANLNFVQKLSMVQEYSLLADSSWFLSRDKFVADINPIGKNSAGFIVRKNATYRNVILNDSSVTRELDKNDLQEEVITAADAAKQTRDFWASVRHEDLSKSEAGIIRMIDTLTNAPAFQKLTKRILFIGTGYMDVGNFQIGPWYNWITSNSWEGTRVRFDFGTNKKFDKRWWYHWYLAYGFGDQKLKGKAELFYLPTRHPRRYWYGSYVNDLDFGQNYYGEVTADNVFALAVRKPGIARKYLKIREARFEYFNEHRSGFSEMLILTHKNFTPLQNLPLKDSFNAGKGRLPMMNFEVALRLRFAYLEKFLETQFFRTSLGSPYPIGELMVSRGFSGVFKSNYKYTKISGSISDYMNIAPWGNISYQVYAGKTFGTLPYVLLDIAPGNELHYYNKYALNMMNRYEFIHDRFAGINIEHNIGNGIFRLIPKLKFRQFWTAKTLWGSLSEENRALNFKEGHLFQTLNGRTYLELGTGVDNILKVFRIDFVWRLLPKQIPDDVTKQFGVFGSFRLAF